MQTKAGAGIIAIAQLLTLDNVPFTECGAEGFTQGTFSSVIELF
jgi:hypothetical protein